MTGPAARAAAPIVAAAPLVVVEDLAFGWDGVALQQGATFSVARGAVFAILGGSGCGKSTLLRHLVGLETPLAGRITIEGVAGAPAAHGRPRFGVSFQSGALLGALTVAENVAVPLRAWSGLPLEAIGAIVAAKLRLVGLEQAGEKLPAELSGGMLKRAGIARAMALEPDLLFLDEPSAGLDPVTAADLDALLLVLNRQLGLTFVVVTHDLASLFAIAGDCILLDRESRSIIARGDPRALRDGSPDPRVHDFLNRTPREATP